ncbi:ParB/RepB/Spo0J family partition protein [Pseudomonas fulva]|uniref:ParB/RepB/Spo0J family partition protein n=1 Tax=Pseudomonas fulva TaxID=47880 RepID=UPI002DBA399B|nr:ParB/RepB/Spo0J family partition protein [Pseudomonas fulva]MEB8059257.1 ParB/RepB/Spo0J family partition protein [Pseudomonas fulva]
MKSKDYPGNVEKTGVRGMRPVADAPATGGANSRAEMLLTMSSSAGDEEIKTTSPGQTNTGIDAQLQSILTTLIDASPYQPRWFFDETALDALATSIQTRGLLKPLIVRPIGNGRFELIGGERRLRACKLAGIGQVLCLVRNYDDHEARILAMTDNEQEDLSDYEWGMGYQKALSDGSETSQRSLARSLGIDSSLVSRRISLTKFPQRIQELLNKNPRLITLNYVKRFNDLIAVNEQIVFEVVAEMFDKGLQQEAALRKIEYKMGSGGGSSVTQTPKKISGLGSFRVSGKRLELKLDKTINSEKLAQKIESFLYGLDATEFHEVESD